MRRLAVLAAVAAVVCLLPASAQAEDPPACSPASAPVAQIAGLPPKLVFGREHSYYIRAKETRDAKIGSVGFSIELLEGGRVWWDDEIDSDEIREWLLPVYANVGDGPITIRVTYLEWRDELFQERPGDYSDAARTDSMCSRTIEATVGVRAGVKLAKPAVSARSGYATFALRRISGCKTEASPTPISLSIKSTRVRRWTTVTAEDQCEGWDGRGRGRHFSLAREPGFGRLTFTPLTPAAHDREWFTYVVKEGQIAGGKRGGRIVKRGRLLVITNHIPARRVYAWNGSSPNDEYWNYCVNNALDIWMHNGNAYCIRPGSTYRDVFAF